MSEKNHDVDVPLAKNKPTEPVHENNFQTITDIAIYWGPNQLNTGYVDYSAPQDWRHNEHLNIPKVVRFHNSGPDEYDDYEGGETPEANWRVLSLTDTGSCFLVLWEHIPGTEDNFGCCVLLAPWTFEEQLAMEERYPIGHEEYFATYEDFECLEEP